MSKIQFENRGVYHLYNRGVEKRDVFSDDNDRWRFLQGLFLFNDVELSANVLWQVERNFGRATFKTIKNFLPKQKRRPLVRLMTDCLMPNHYHLLVEQIEDNGVSKFMQKIGTGYTIYFNKKHDRVGPLFQGAFRAVAVEDDEQLKYLLFYINVINPGQLLEPNLKEKHIASSKKIMSFVADYSWSTHQEYSGRRDSFIVDKGLLGEIFSTPKEYLDFVKSCWEERIRPTKSVGRLFLE